MESRPSGVPEGINRISLKECNTCRIVDTIDLYGCPLVDNEFVALLSLALFFQTIWRHLSGTIMNILLLSYSTRLLFKSVFLFSIKRTKTKQKSVRKVKV